MTGTMLGTIRQACALVALGALAACSLQGAIDAMVSDEDREMVEEFIDDIRDGNLEDLREEFDEDIWAQSEPQLEAAAELFPEGDSETRFVAYSVNSNLDDGDRRTTKEFRVLTTDEDTWTITQIDTTAVNGRQRITAWNVEAYDEEPEEVAVLESAGTVMLWFSIIGLAFLIGVVVLIVWLIRRSRRNTRAYPGAIPPTVPPPDPPAPPVT
ncbi:MAG: hypothetical protein H7X93_09935 [Sphingomonadaceae bacterium]|nr:hypothetical protein [Sphingomonadaceae bacterium]